MGALALQPPSAMALRTEKATGHVTGGRGRLREGLRPPRTPAAAIERNGHSMLVWERLQSDDEHLVITRAKLPKGWLVRVVSNASGGLTFYPDQDHLWDGTSEGRRAAEPIAAPART
jgi:hypothetical protein